MPELWIEWDLFPLHCLTIKNYWVYNRISILTNQHSLSVYALIEKKP